MPDSHDKNTTVLLRYRFDNQQQLQQHLHVVDGRGIFFFRDTHLPYLSGQRVVLEILLAGSDQQAILRGHILGRDEGRSEGVWLEFLDARLARRAAEAPIVGRQQRRMPTDLVIEVKGELPAQLCRLSDVSPSGARLGGMAAPLNPGSAVNIRLIAPPAGITQPATVRAQVLRSFGSDAAVRFVREDANTRVLVTKLQAAVQQSWLQARELTHPPPCCKEGGVLEPPMPRINVRHSGKKPGT